MIRIALILLLVLVLPQAPVDLFDRRDDDAP